MSAVDKKCETCETNPRKCRSVDCITEKYKDWTPRITRKEENNGKEDNDNN